MKPTREQELTMRRWLVNRVIAIEQHTSSLPRGPLIEEAIDTGVDFSGLYLEFGFEADGLTPAKDFREVQKRRRQRKAKIAATGVA